LRREPPFDLVASTASENGRPRWIRLAGLFVDTAAGFRHCINMTEIPLTKGYVSLVDDEDADALLPFKWNASVRRGRVYALRGWREGNGFGHAYIHRVVAERMGLDLAGKVVDHINGDGLDNRRCNIRAVTVRENIRNQRGALVSPDGVPGICRRTDTRWEAWIRNGGEGKRYLGSFKTRELAVEARLKAERELWGVQPRRAWQHD